MRSRSGPAPSSANVSRAVSNSIAAEVVSPSAAQDSPISTAVRARSYGMLNRCHARPPPAGASTHRRSPSPSAAVPMAWAAIAASTAGVERAAIPASSSAATRTPSDPRPPGRCRRPQRAAPAVRAGSRSRRGRGDGGRRRVDIARGRARAGPVPASAGNPRRLACRYSDFGLVERHRAVGGAPPPGSGPSPEPDAEGW